MPLPIRPSPPLPAYSQSAADKSHLFDFDICSLISGAFYTGIMATDMALCAKMLQVTRFKSQAEKRTYG
jgi:hypothetical protein